MQSITFNRVANKIVLNLGTDDEQELMEFEQVDIEEYRNGDIYIRSAQERIADLVAMGWA